MAGQMSSEGAEVLDEGFPATVDGSLSPEKYSRLQELLRDGKDSAVVEATLFHEPLQQQALNYLRGIPKVEVKWIGFANDADAASHNSLHRKDKVNPDGPGHKAINDRWTRLAWTFPKGAETRPIYKLPCLVGPACSVCNPVRDQP